MLLEHAVHFGRRLREVGLRVTTGQIALFLESLALIDVTDRRAFHDVARAAFVSDSQEIDAFEAAFAEFWTFAPPQLAPPAPPAAPAPPPFARSARSFTSEADSTR